jgi:membrane-associated protein
MNTAMGSVVDHLLSTPTALMYVLVGLLVFAEDALFVGFVLPGETAAILGGVDASRHHVHLAAMIALVVAAAILGDSAGFEIGHRYGPRILTLPVFARHQRQLTDAQRFLARRGGGAVFLGRFVAFFRALMPALAGIAHMPYRRFLLFNAAGPALGHRRGCARVPRRELLQSRGEDRRPGRRRHGRTDRPARCPRLADPTSPPRPPARAEPARAIG